MTLPNILNALAIAADEMDYAFAHGLHEVGIPVTEILRELRIRIMNNPGAISEDRTPHE